MLYNSFQWARHQMGDLNAVKHVLPWIHLSLHPERHLILLSHFCRAHGHDQHTQTEAQTDHTMCNISAAAAACICALNAYSVG